MASRTYSMQEAADRVGLESEFIERLTGLAIVRADDDGRFSEGAVRRAQLAYTLDRAGISLEGLAAGLASGEISLEFLDTEQYQRFSALADETFTQVSTRTNVPIDLLYVIRESIGRAQPSPDDRLREDELPIVAFIEEQVRLGFSACSDRAAYARDWRGDAAHHRAGGGLVADGGAGARGRGGCPR